MDQIEIAPMSVDLVEGFHRALDAVARERKYFAILEAFPVEAMRAFTLNQIKTDAPAFAALGARRGRGLVRHPDSAYLHTSGHGRYG